MTSPQADLTPVILQVDVNGNVQRSQNPHVPTEPAEVAADALRCMAAGAAVVHTHSQERGFGAMGALDAGPYEEAWRLIAAQRPDCLLHPTVRGGGPGIQMEARYDHVFRLARAGLLGFGPLDAGTMNVGGLDARGAPSDVDAVFQTTFRDIRYALSACRQLGVGVAASIFEPGFLRAILAFARAGDLPTGSFVKIYVQARAGSLSGLPATQLSLDAYLQLLHGSGVPWFVSVLGGDVVASGLARYAMERGGHVVIGIEPYGGDRIPTNLELVEEAVALARDVGRPVATPRQAREILELPPR